MSKIKIKLSEFWSYARAYIAELCSDGRFSLFVLILSVFVVAGHAAIMGGVIHSVTETQGIVTATDNDGGIAIETVLKTQLINNNGFTAYGPTYYRAVRILDMFLHLGAFASGPDSREQLEKSIHFFLMLTSYFGLLGLSFMISFILFQAWPVRLLSTVAFAGSFLHDDIWAQMIFFPHPDHLLGFAIAVAGLMTWRYLMEPEDRKKFLFATAAWGFVMSIKMTVILFAPVLALLLLPLPLSRRLWPSHLWKKGLLIVAGIAISYFTFAFPQSLDFLRVLEFMRDQKSSVIAGSGEFFLQWLQLFWSQLRQPLFIIVVLSVLVPVRSSGRSEKFAWKHWFLFVGAILLSILYLMSRRVLSPHDWYPIPFIAAIMVALALACVQISQKVECLYPRTVKKVRSYLLYSCAFFVLLSYFRPLIPSAVARSVSIMQYCRPEAHIVQEKVNAVAERGGGVLADPYIPYLRKYHDKEIRMAWEMQTDLIKPGITDMIALKADYYGRYLPAEKDISNTAYLYIKDWNKTQAFYMLFHNHETAVDPHGQTWKRTYTDKCSFELWERVK